MNELSSTFLNFSRSRGAPSPLQRCQGLWLRITNTDTARLPRCRERLPSVHQGSKAEVISGMQREARALQDVPATTPARLPRQPRVSGRRADVGRETPCRLRAAGRRRPTRDRPAPKAPCPVFRPPRRFLGPHCRGGAQPCGRTPSPPASTRHVPCPWRDLIQGLRVQIQAEELRKPVGAGVGVKPNKPKATDYQRPLTTEEAPGDPLLPTPRANSVTVKGKKFDKAYSYVTTATRCSLGEDTCYVCPHLNFFTKFTLYITFWTNFLPFHC